MGRARSSSATQRLFAPINTLADAARHKVAYVSGDRKREGMFANLSIFENMLAPLYRAKSRAASSRSSTGRR